MAGTVGDVGDARGGARSGLTRSKGVYPGAVRGADHVQKALGHVIRFTMKRGANGLLVIFVL